jgi:TolA-binding protein
MNLLCSIIPSILAALCLLAVSTTARTQVTSGKEHSPAADAPSRDDSASLQKKANEAEARIRGNEGDSDQLKKAVKLNEVALAKEILLRNGFTAKDLENAKISLLTGGGKGGEDSINISATCCDPKEITIQRTLENFTKTR